MSESLLPLITHEEIRAAADPRSYARGAEYYRRGRVLDLTWSAAEGRLVGQVRGSGIRLYTTTVWLAGPIGASTITTSSCSCPIGARCKHVVAVLLSLQESAVANPLLDVPEPDLRAPRPAARKGQSAPPVPARPPKPPTPVWKTALGPVLRAGPPMQIGHTHVPLGLQFRVDGLKKALEAGAAAADPATVRVQVRPVQKGPKGGWSGGYGVGWTPGRYGRVSYDPEVAAVVEELGSVWGASAYGYGYGYSSGEWRTLADFAPSAVWTLLDRAVELEVPLVGNAARDVVELAGRADLELDLAALPDGVVQLRRRLTFDDEPMACDLVGSVGVGGLFGVEIDGPRRRLVLGPTEQRITEGEQALLGFPGARIPASDVSEFVDTAVPRLRRQVRLRSIDGSVTLPESPTPRLLLSIATTRPDRLQLTWQWLYGSARRPLHGLDPLRDPAAERATQHRVEELAGPTLMINEHAELAGSAAITFARDVLPVLEDSPDVIIEAPELPAYREIEDAPLITVAADESDDPDWFDLGIRVDVEGREVPLALLISALALEEEYLLLDDGSYLRTDLPALHQLRGLVEEARRLEDRPGPLRLNRYAASLWGDFAELADIVEQSKRWQETVGALAALSREGLTPASTPLPDGLVAELRHYQQEAFDWLVFLHQHGLGGILADDMGLGKTVEVLALLEHVRAAGGDHDHQPHRPLLVVAPASVISNWAAEADRFTPKLRTVVVSSTLGRLGVPIELVAEADVVVTSYAIFRLEFDDFSSVEWAGLIMDEAQFLKNPKTRANECARLLRAPFKLAVTGTPLENNLQELWAMLAVVAPGLLGSATRFRDDYVKVVADGLRARQALAHDDAGHLENYGPPERDEDLEIARQGEEALRRLRRRIRPILLRRTKEQVAPELPDRVEQELGVELAPKHRRAYDLLLQRERQRVLRLLDDDFEGNRFTIFRSLTLLRRAALDISLTDPERYAGVPSAKLDVLFEQLEEVVASGHRALVFSQFTTFLTKIADRADREGVGYEYLDGATRKRAQVIDRFKQGDAPLFLISLKAGGFGLNLTEADYVFLMDPWWNPATENQAIDRTHRIGQRRTVMVSRLVSTGTIEEKVMALKARKAELFSAVLDDDEGAFSGSLGADDIRGLFGV